MHSPITFELIIDFKGDRRAQTKEEVKAWLSGRGEDTFVEGVVDNVDIDFEYDLNARDFYSELGGDSLPLLIYKYNRDHLSSLAAELERFYGDAVACKINSLETKVWQEGWKDSFKPIATRTFYVYPPWHHLDVAHGIPIEIEPGMAFGTGQHATTKLCLGVIEDIGDTFSGRECLADKSFLDVGTGTGILGIAAFKSGWGKVVGTDIDPDCLIAAERNAKANGVSMRLVGTSFPDDEALAGYDCVVANILSTVLLRIVDPLCNQVRPGGWLVLSGILAEDEEPLLRATAPYGLRSSDVRRMEGWSALVLRKEP